ncbi:MAG: hypothetical protein WBL05_14030 [Brooklawnia sp.]|uniref:hypothetical protein n=1 Tax=Brooklawnia sp. TaxID=2699740 RepID=UPI003C73BFA0
MPTGAWRGTHPPMRRGGDRQGDGCARVQGIDDLAENWEYTPVEGSFNDTIEVLQWRGVLTAEQVDELAGFARRTQEEGRG